MGRVQPSTVFNICIGGEAGQGLVTMGELLTKSLVRSGYQVVVRQGYMSRIRGGHNTYEIRVSTDEIHAPQEPVDLLVALNEETIELHRDELSEGGLVLAEDDNEALQDGDIAVPLQEMAEGKFINVAALGTICALLGLDEDLVGELIHERFGKSNESVMERNEQALAAGYDWAHEQYPVDAAILAETEKTSERMTLNGNEAIALGALSAGIKFYSFYPMTPATSVGLNIIKHAEKMGVVYEQAEDEISAINMAIGASYAGAPAMCATSGGGFALMCEGVSLAGMTETPVVVTVAQRPGPATGLPTRTGQEDLEFVLHGGHGEFPRAIFAPGTVEQCFHLARQAFMIAEETQSPVFILTDQYLADSSRAVEPFDVQNLNAVQVPADVGEIGDPYRRYEVTESGVSPRLLPGTTENLVCVDSDEHTFEGHMTEDLDIHVQIDEKRLRKIDIMREQFIAPELIGDADAETLLVCWGSSRGACIEASGRLPEDAAVLHFSQVWPLVVEEFIDMLNSADRTVVVEGNATGQFAKLLKREAGFECDGVVTRYDGLPFTPEYILRALERS